MAIYHLSMKLFSRKDNRSSTKAAAYRSASKIEDERTNEIYDYTRKRGVIYTEIVMPASESISWTPSRSELWNAVEMKNKREDSVVCREVEIALPVELTDEQRRELTQNFAHEIADKYGIGVDISIHKPDTGSKNYHAHLLITTNRIEGEGLGNKTRELDSIATRQVDKTSQNATEYLRGRWEELANENLRSVGFDVRIDSRTLEAQGIDREATQHEGKAVTAMERKKKNKIKTRIHAENERRVQEDQARRETVSDEWKRIEDGIDKEYSEAEVKAMEDIELRRLADEAARQKKLEEEAEAELKAKELEREREKNAEQKMHFRKLVDEFGDMKGKHLGKIVLVKDGDNFVTFAFDGQEVAKQLGMAWKFEDTVTLNREQLDKLRHRSGMFEFVISDNGKEYGTTPYRKEKSERADVPIAETRQMPPAQFEIVGETESYMMGLHVLFGAYRYDRQPDGSAFYAMWVDSCGLKKGDVAIIESKDNISVMGKDEKIIEDALKLADNKWKKGFVVNGTDEQRERIEKVAERLGLLHKISNKRNNNAPPVQEIAVAMPEEKQNIVEPEPEVTEIPYSDYDRAKERLKREADKINSEISTWEWEHGKLERDKYYSKSHFDSVKKSEPSGWDKFWHGRGETWREELDEAIKRLEKDENAIKAHGKRPYPEKFDVEEFVHKKFPNEMKIIDEYKQQAKKKDAEIAELRKKLPPEHGGRMCIRAKPYGYESYEGEIVMVDSKYTIQKTPGGLLVFHENKKLERVPQEGEDVRISYSSDRNERASVYTRDRVREYAEELRLKKELERDRDRDRGFGR